MSVRKTRMTAFRAAQERVQARNADARKHAFTRRPSPESEMPAEVETREVDS